MPTSTWSSAVAAWLDPKPRPLPTTANKATAARKATAKKAPAKKKAAAKKRAPRKAAR